MSATRGQILVVEDNGPLREALSGLLEDEGYTVLQAGDGAEALRSLRDARPSLIILDLSMPRMDGPSFRAHQRADPALREIPVLVTTADRRHDEDFYAAVGDEWVRKPYPIEELLQAVARLVRRGGEGGERAA